MHSLEAKRWTEVMVTKGNEVTQKGEGWRRRTLKGKEGWMDAEGMRKEKTKPLAL